MTREFKEYIEASLAAALILTQYFPRAQKTVFITSTVYIEPSRISEEL